MDRDKFERFVLRSGLPEETLARDFGFGGYVNDLVQFGWEAFQEASA